jgi:hypothetical protein
MFIYFERNPSVVSLTDVENRKVKIRYGELLLQELPMLDSSGCLWAQSIDFAGINTPGNTDTIFPGFVLFCKLIFPRPSYHFLQQLWA